MRRRRKDDYSELQRNGSGKGEHWFTRGRVLKNRGPTLKPAKSKGGFLAGAHKWSRNALQTVRPGVKEKSKTLRLPKSRMKKVRKQPYKRKNRLRECNK